MNDTIKIETGIKMPTRGTGLTATFKAMKVGNSITLPTGMRNTVFSTARSAKVKVSTRMVGEGKIRVWRMA